MTPDTRKTRTHTHIHVRVHMRVRRTNTHMTNELFCLENHEKCDIQWQWRCVFVCYVCERTKNMPKRKKNWIYRFVRTVRCIYVICTALGLLHTRCYTLMNVSCEHRIALALDSRNSRAMNPTQYDADVAVAAPASMAVCGQNSEEWMKTTSKTDRDWLCTCMWPPTRHYSRYLESVSFVCVSERRQN